MDERMQSNGDDTDAAITIDEESAPGEPTAEEQATDRLIADIAPAGSGLDDNLDHAVEPIVISTLRTLSG